MCCRRASIGLRCAAATLCSTCMPSMRLRRGSAPDPAGAAEQAAPCYQLLRNAHTASQVACHLRVMCGVAPHNSGHVCAVQFDKPMGHRILGHPPAQLLTPANTCPAAPTRTWCWAGSTCRRASGRLRGWAARGRRRRRRRWRHASARTPRPRWPACRRVRGLRLQATTRVTGPAKERGGGGGGRRALGPARHLRRLDGGWAQKISEPQIAVLTVGRLFVLATCAGRPASAPAAQASLAEQEWVLDEAHAQLLVTVQAHAAAAAAVRGPAPAGGGGGGVSAHNGCYVGALREHMLQADR